MQCIQGLSPLVLLVVVMLLRMVVVVVVVWVLVVLAIFNGVGSGVVRGSDGTNGAVGVLS